VRFPTQEQLVRKAVLEGLGRALGQLYAKEQVGEPTENINQLLVRLSNGQPIDVAPDSFISADSPTGLRARRRGLARSR
jgi:hypothetical protein